MPEEKEQKPEYGDRYADIRFQYLDKVIDRMEKSSEKTVNEIRSEVNEIRLEVKEIRSEVKEIKNEFKVEVDEIKKDNKATRRWVTGTVIGTGIAVVSGIGAIFFAFAQIQTSWMQQVISFALKAIK